MSKKYLCKPFIKWVGGKTQLLPEILKRLPSDIERFYEPFIGGGALFFALQAEKATISDINPELINLYKIVQNNVEELIIDLKKHIYEEEYFYKIRNIDRTDEFMKLSPIERASRFIFLNKTCFNGLYRVNSKGYFNVPFGKYVNPKIADAENLRLCSQALANVEINLEGFESIESKITPVDFVYFDPPYVPLNTSSNFTSYSKEGFDIGMQESLYKLCCRLNNKGIKFMASNSSAPFVIDLYKDFKVELVKASRAINSIAEKRGAVNEVIVTNY